MSLSKTLSAAQYCFKTGIRQEMTEKSRLGPKASTQIKLQSDCNWSVSDCLFLFKLTDNPVRLTNIFTMAINSTPSTVGEEKIKGKIFCF